MDLYGGPPDEPFTTSREAMWIIEAGMREMMTRETYRAAKFTGMWKGKEVAGFEIVRTVFGKGEQTIGIPGLSSQRIAQPASSQVATNQTSFAVPSNKSTGIGIDQRKAVITYSSDPIDKRDIFMTLIWSMMSLASKRITPVNKFSSRTRAVSATGLQILDTWNGIKHPEPAADFNSDDLINLLRNGTVIPSNIATGPPTPPTPPYPIPNTHPSLVLVLQEHYPYDPPPVPLSRSATIHMLTSAKRKLDLEIDDIGGDHEVGYGRVFIEDEVQIFFNTGREFTVWDASAAMQGIITMITAGLLETKEMVLDLLEGPDEKNLGSMWISKQIFAKGVVAALNSSSNLLDPTNYRVPGTGTTVSLQGHRPYGAPLPIGYLVGLLDSAQEKASLVIERLGQDAVLPPGMWRFESHVVRIDVHTRAPIACKYKSLIEGIEGLIDLMTEPGGIGPVAAGFVFGEDGEGEVARGQLTLLVDTVA
ncbi:MAG: hypothetical protein Q9169_004288 [Polycauliona sp. 2 TL-2023]